MQSTVYTGISLYGERVSVVRSMHVHVLAGGFVEDMVLLLSLSPSLTQIRHGTTLQIAASMTYSDCSVFLAQTSSTVVATHSIEFTHIHSDTLA